MEKSRGLKADDNTMPRSIGQEIFKTIVEMSYEMAYWDRANKEYRHCLQMLDELYDPLENKRNKRVLRSLTTKTKEESPRSQPFFCMEKRFYHTVHFEYERYTDEQNKIRERGIFTLTISNHVRDLRYFIRGRYTNDDEWATEKQQVKEIYLSNLGYTLWSRPSKKSIKCQNY